VLETDGFSDPVPGDAGPDPPLPGDPDFWHHDGNAAKRIMNPIVQQRADIRFMAHLLGQAIRLLP
jgi:hypothetical protein